MKGNNQYTANLLPNNKTLTCKQCGNKQTFANKYSYRRAMGISQNPSDLSNSKIENAGLCGKCRRSAKRKGWKLSKQNAEKNKLNAYNFAHNTNYTDVSQIPIFPISKRRYTEKVKRMSETQLKIHKPDEYKRLMNNRYDGTDLDMLTIDHIKEVGWHYHNRKSIEECSHIDNLEVITMRENMLRYNPNIKFKK